MANARGDRPRSTEESGPARPAAARKPAAPARKAAGPAAGIGPGWAGARTWLVRGAAAVAVVGAITVLAEWSARRGLDREGLARVAAGDLPPPPKRPSDPAGTARSFDQRALQTLVSTATKPPPR